MALKAPGSLKTDLFSPKSSVSSFAMRSLWSLLTFEAGKHCSAELGTQVLAATRENVDRIGKVLIPAERLYQGERGGKTR